MNPEETRVLIERIHQDLKELRIVLTRINDGWERARRSNDDYYLDSVALNLHGFYSGFERIFALIAEFVDREIPQGEKWHLLLLERMQAEKTGVRPAVISSASWKTLNELRGFRHVVRNVYTHNFDPAKVGLLVVAASPLFEQLNAELSAFTDFLEQA
ncbi:MAG: hypothetical protein Q7T89_16865 [Anaerolineales bacterium]|nr:hypothetical protein [Anaerolineales bacterium]